LAGEKKLFKTRNNCYCYSTDWSEKFTFLLVLKYYNLWILLKIFLLL